MSAKFAVLMIAVPLLLAFLSILIKKQAWIVLLFTGIFNIVMLFILQDGVGIMGGHDATSGGFASPIGIVLLMNTYARVALFLINGLFVVIALLNIKEYKSYSIILLIALAGLNGLVLTNDLFNLFVFLEISGIAAYLITTSNKKPASTFHYLVLGAVGSSLFLFGLIILYAMFGTLNMVDMMNKIQASGIDYSSLALPFLLMFIGLGVEAKLLPFNSWVKGILGNSNTLSGPMIASVYASAMTFVLGRLVLGIFHFEGMLLTIVIVLLAMGIILGDAMAFASKKVREILLFSSVAQASIVILLFVNGVISWAIWLIVANALSKTLMFLVINKATKAVGDDNMNALAGLFTNNYFVGVTFTLATLSVMGLPLLAGFVIKLSFLTQLAASDHIWLIAIILLASVIEGIYFVRLLVKLWYKGDKEISVKYHLGFKAVFVVIALALLVFGTYRAPLENLDSSVDSISEVIG